MTYISEHIRTILSRGWDEMRIAGTEPVLPIWLWLTHTRSLKPLTSLVVFVWLFGGQPDSIRNQGPLWGTLRPLD